MFNLAYIFNGLRGRVGGDFADKLNCRYTVAIVAALAVITSIKQYLGTPIQCWVPIQFADSWEQYAEEYCWVQSTYYNPLQDPIPLEFSTRNARHTGYYLWVPLVLALQALMFYIPVIIWRGILLLYPGADIQRTVQTACDCRMMLSESRTASLQTLADYIRNTMCSGRPFPGYVTIVYILMKVMCAVNLIGQFFLLKSFLGVWSITYGLRSLNDLLNGGEWQTSSHFPRSTMCDFEIRVLGNVHHNTVQCVLPINMLNEMTFFFLYFWFVFVAVVTLCSLAYWLITSVIPRQQEQSVENYLEPNNPFTDGSKTAHFVHKCLGRDGVFCLRMISAHAGDVVAADLTKMLWNDFNNKTSEKQVAIQPIYPDLPIHSLSDHKSQEAAFNADMSKISK